MEEKKFVKIFRTAKIVQLCTLLAIELTFFLVLTYNPNLTRQIYSSKPLFTLCTITWVLMVFGFLSLLYDFFKLRTFAIESHELKKTAYLDSLTGIPNRQSLDALIRTYNTSDSLAHIGCIIFTLSNLGVLNESLGYTVGDSALLDFSNILDQTAECYGFTGRNGGNEFVVIINDCRLQIIQDFMAALQDKIQEYNEAHQNAPLEFSSSYSLNEDEKATNISQLLAITYKKLSNQSRK